MILVAGVANLVVSNGIASQRFALAVEKKELNTMGNALAAQQLALDGGTSGMANLLSIAQQRGMVPGQQGDTMFLNTGVAYANGSAQSQN